MNRATPYLALAMSTVTMIGGGGAVYALKTWNYQHYEAIRRIDREQLYRDVKFLTKMSRVDRRLSQLDSDLVSLRREYNQQRIQMASVLGQSDFVPLTDVQKLAQPLPKPS